MNHKQMFVIITIIIAIISISVIGGVYVANQSPVGHNTPPATVVFNQNEDTVTMDITHVDEKRANNIFIQYNNTVIADNLTSGEIVTLYGFKCNNTIYVYDEENGELEGIVSYKIDCVN